jgi:hypothetical protein
MSTSSATRARVKPARSIRIVVPPSEGGAGVVRIAVGKAAADYVLRPMPSDFGSAFELLKVGDDAADPHHVCLEADGGSCSCTGFLRHHHCKHRDGLAALRRAGRI